MLFGIINATARTVEIADHPSDDAAKAQAGLVNVDHGVVLRATDKAHGIAIMVYEYGLFEPPEQQSFFGLAGRLYAGNAVLYAFNAGGDTVDLKVYPRVMFMPSVRAVERNIQLGLIQRPIMSANDVVIWQWPAPAPKGMR